MEWFEVIRHAADSALRSVMGMRPKFILHRAKGVTELYSAKTASVREASEKRKLASTSSAIVKSRPLHFEERYIVSQDSRQADMIFTQLRNGLFEDCDMASEKARRNAGGKMIYREQGKTSEGRPFLFFKPFSDYGWLLERSGAGWRLSRAEKIVSQQMFLRSHSDPWDVVLLYEDPKGEGSPRVKSQRFGGTLMSPQVYERRMRESFMAELIGS